MSNLTQFIDDRLKMEADAASDWELVTPGHPVVSDEPGDVRTTGITKAYEPPRVIFIGKIRDVTTGSASSGNKDANSQYYW